MKSRANILFRDFDNKDGASSYERDIRKWKRAYERKKDKLDGKSAIEMKDTMKNLAESEVKLKLLVEKLRDKE